ncbi:hypothetical protein [Nocardioides ultimimeridianus]
MRRLLAAALIAGPLTVLGVAPAHAVPAAPTFSNLDASTPGHVTGTVTSDQPYVFVRMDNDTATSMVTLAGGTGSFDLETWGYGSGSGTTDVQAAACPTATADGSCSSLATSAAFTPTDVTPQVTWFDDGTIGPGQGDPSITVSDTGGGDLHAIFVSDGQRFDTVVAHNGTTVLPADADGSGYVRITRCRSGSPFVCNDLGFTAPLEHDLAVRRTASAVWLRDVGVATAAAPDPVYTVDPTPSTAEASYTLSWHLETGSPATQVGGGGTATGSLTAGTPIAVTLDTTDVPDGDYTVVGTLTLHDPDFGTYTDVPVEGGSLRVDKTGPTIDPGSLHVTHTYVRPESGAGDDLVTITATGANAEDGDTWTVLGPTGQLVRSFLPGIVTPGQSWEAQFDGRDEDGVPLPSGGYTVQLSDANGNLGPTLKVQVQRLAARTFTKTVTAKASKVDQYVGRCSRLASPSSHGWAGSLGYFANTRCRSTTGVDSTVATEHSVRLPAAATYRDVQISAYGGAAKGFGRSVAVMYYEDPSRNNKVAKTILGARAGTWAGPRKAASTMVKRIGSARYVFWTAGTAARQHYDVKGFTVTVRYQIWQ